MNVNPQDILFSLPTINDDLPSALSEGHFLTDALALHEDDWRQFEWVSASLQPLVLKELAEIDKIWSSFSVPSGNYTAFKKLHVRQLLPKPIAHLIPAASLESLFPTEWQHLTFHGHSSALRNVVATRVGGLIFYAGTDNGYLLCWGLYREQSPNLDHETALKITQFMQDQALLLVHWPSRTLFQSLSSVEQFLEGKFNRK